MINFAGKSILKHNIDNFNKLGINEIVIVRGYLANKINFDNVKYYDNPNFRKTNMVASLFCAESELNGDCIILYSDILLDLKLMSIIVSSKFDIGVTVDYNFEEYWRSRLGDAYSEDMESQISRLSFELITSTRQNIIEVNIPGQNGSRFDIGSIENLSKIYQMRETATGMHNQSNEK